MKSTALRVGDKVSGLYHGVAYTGFIDSRDGSGYLYVTLDTPITVYGDEKAGLAIHPNSDERDSMRIVSRPEHVTLRELSNAAMGLVVLIDR